MGRFVALMTSEPFLVRCELHRVRADVLLDAPDQAVGVGAYEEHTTLLRRYGPGAPRTDLWEAPESDAVVLMAQSLAVGRDNRPVMFIGSVQEFNCPLIFQQRFHADLMTWNIDRVE